MNQLPYPDTETIVLWAGLAYYMRPLLKTMMDTTAHGPEETLNPAVIEQLKLELNALDQDLVEIDGSRLKPSQCYRFEVDPVHVMFNTNCPDSLKQKIEAILSKHLKPDENSTP